MLPKGTSVFVVFSLLVIMTAIFSHSQVLAAANCRDQNITLGENNLNSSFIKGQTPATLIVTASGSGVINGVNYDLLIEDLNCATCSSRGETAQNNSVQFNWTNNRITSVAGVHNLLLRESPTKTCVIGQFTVTDPASSLRCDYVHISQTRNGAKCYGGPNGCLDKTSGYLVETKIITQTGTPYTGPITIKFCGRYRNISTSANGVYSGSFGSENPQTCAIQVEVNNPPPQSNVDICSASVAVSDSCNGQCQSSPENIGANVMAIANEPYKICDQIDRTQDYLQDAYDKCIACIGGETGAAGIWTAIGCIPRDPTTIVQNLLRVGLGMGGGVALLMCLAAGFLFSTSQGDPKRTGEAKELLTAAITGLLFIIFSVVILQFIGFTVLKIPGFGG